jgi:cyclopropane fatty-acyl-phospholipid synthase-like methyltransferase
VTLSIAEVAAIAEADLPAGEAQRNVAHHYDLGNDFYRLFLNEGMQYSCACFTDPDETLEEAQRNKLRLIPAKLRLAPGLKVQRCRPASSTSGSTPCWTCQHK